MAADPRSPSVAKERAAGCVARWPECEEGAYHPDCCRFPKSCSCTVAADRLPDPDAKCECGHGPGGHDARGKCWATIYAPAPFGNGAKQCDCRIFRPVSAAVPPAEPPEILDACCGGRMWWWDKAHPLAVYMDTREAPRGAVGTLTGRPEWNPSWECAPDVLGDFRAMPFEDGSFQQVVFDPPHIVRASQPPEGINGLKYGALHPDTEQDDLRRGFAECWRVLAPGGTLVFKWAGALDRVEPHFPAAPTVGSRNAPRGSKGLGTRWFIFYKPLGDSDAR